VRVIFIALLCTGGSISAMFFHVDLVRPASYLLRQFQKKGFIHKIGKPLLHQCFRNSNEKNRFKICYEDRNPVVTSE